MATSAGALSRSQASVPAESSLCQSGQEHMESWMLKMMKRCHRPSVPTKRAAIQKREAGREEK